MVQITFWQIGQGHFKISQIIKGCPDCVEAATLKWGCWVNLFSY